MDNKKTILYLITQSHYGGAQKYVRDLALNVPKNSNFKTLVAVGEGDEQSWMKDLTANGIEVLRLKHVRRNLSLLHDMASGFELFKLYRKIQPDVIHLNSSKIGSTGAVAARIFNITSYGLLVTGYAQVVYTVHGLILNEPLSAWRKAYYWLAEWFGSLFKDTLIAVSEYDKQSLLKYKIAPQKKITVIHNGIDLNNLNFLPKEKAREQLLVKSGIRNQELKNIKSTFNIQHSEIIVGTISGLYQTKGLNYLIESLHLLVTDYSLRVTYFIIGAGPEHDHLKILIKKYNLEKNVILTGSIENAAQYLKAFDIFVLPSVKEGLSYTLIEARAASIPIIATHVGGNPEIITHQKTGILVPPKDPKVITETLHTLIKDEILRENLSQQTMQNVNMFSLEQMTEKTIKIYDNP